MKKIITLYCLFFYILVQSQTPISSYYSAPNSSFGIIDPTIVLNQTSGTNQTWNFTNLVKIGESVDSYSTPTSQETTLYPGTNSTLTISSVINTTNTSNQLFTNNTSNQISITALKGVDFEINYNTNNALIGIFPLNYGYNNVDNVGGSFVYQTNSGTFTGTITTTVDAYGTLNTNDIGFGTFSGNVTRLRTVQNLNLSSGIFTNIGTATQTNYNYYDTSTGYLVFRYSSININVPILAINQTNTSIESFQTILLSRAENELNNSIVLFPNPLKSELNIQNLLSINIESIRILDSQGKEILKNSKKDKIDLSNIANGIYIAIFETEKGSITKKIIKE